VIGKSETIAKVMKSLFLRFGKPSTLQWPNDRNGCEDGSGCSNKPRMVVEYGSLKKAVR
jgi:hypothetical protein